MKRRKFFTALLIILAFIAIQHVLYPRFYRANYLFAEDAGVFINDYLHEGFNILKPFGGYLVVVARLIAIFVVSIGKLFNDFNVLAFTMKGCNILFSTLVLYYFTTDRFDFLIKNRKHRVLLMSMLLVAACQYVDIIFCTIGTHWWGGLLVFFAALELLHNQLPSKWVILPLVLCILSSPSGLLMAFGVLGFIINYLLAKKDRKQKINFWPIAFIILVVLVLALQAYFILFRSDVDSISKGLSVKHLAESIWYACQSAMGVTTQIFGVNVSSSLMTSGIGVAVGGVLWLVLAYFAMKNKKMKYVILSFVSILFLYVMVFYKVDHGGVSSYYDMIVGPAKHIWYHFMPSIIAIILSAIIFMDKITEKHFSYLCLVCVFLALLFIGGRSPIETKINTDLNLANEYLDFSSDTHAVVNVAPYAETYWYTYVHVPVKPEYCDLKGVKCESYK